MNDKRIETVLTREDLVNGFKELGIKKGMVLETHTSLSAFGYIVGSAQTMVDAYLECVGYDGTLVMPNQNSDNTEPSAWINPPVNRDLYQTIRDNTPAFNRKNSDEKMMGKTVDNFLRREGAVVSESSCSSYVAWGKYARLICGHQPLHFQLGDDSATRQLYDLNGYCLLAGVGYDKATCMHLAEYRSNKKEVILNGGAVEIDGKRYWKKYLDISLDSDEFIEIGKLMEENGLVNKTTIGNAVCYLFNIRDAVDFATAYYEELK